MTSRRLALLGALCAALAPAAAAAQTAGPSPTSSAGSPTPPPDGPARPTGTSDSAPPTGTSDSAPSTGTSDSAPPAEAAPPPPPQPIDVSVTGDRPPAGTSTLRKRDIREMPGILADPYRAIEIKPGVTPTASGLPYFFIRGAPPGNVGYFFDGIQVPLLFHVGGGPSVIPAAIVQKVSFSPGPYPASAGRFAGAIVEATSTQPPFEWKGEAGLRLDVGGVIQGPATDKIDVLVGGHYSYAGPLVSALIPSVGAGYGDYQARVGYTPSPGSRVQLFAFGSYDYLALIDKSTAGDVKTTLLDTDFHRVDLKYQKDFDEGGRAFAAATLGLDQSRNVGARLAQQYKLAARGGIELPVLSGKATFRAGADVSLDDFHFQPCVEAAATDRCAPGDTAEERNKLISAYRDLFKPRLDTTIGGYVETELRVGERSTITPGLRVDYYHSLEDSDVAIDPKLMGRFVVNDHLALVPGVAVASQRPAFAPLPALVIAGIPGGLQRSIQGSFGAEVRFGPIEIVSAVFRQVTFGLTDAIGTGRGTALDADRFLHRSTGDTYGLEIGAQGPLRKDMLFLVSYTLSRATRRTDDGRTVPSAYDRTHVAQVALLYDLGNGWRAGLRHMIYSGFPADEVGPGRVPSTDPPRVKPFYRLDARLSKRWTIGKKGWLSAALDFQNATLNKEVFDVTCTANGCAPRTIGPIAIPALMIEAGF
ncbi:MAG: TonB-dependent receptor [Polyangiaceae bacterium]